MGEVLEKQQTRITARAKTQEFTPGHQSPFLVCLTVGDCNFHLLCYPHGITNPSADTLNPKDAPNIAKKATKTAQKPWHVLRPPMPWHKPRVRPADGEMVILIHGLWRSMWAMDPMAAYLHQLGYHTINVPYPSFRKPIEASCQIVHQAIQDHNKQGPIHFVTHSLGGIVTRKLLADLPKKQTGRVVMLAPPNQGSEIIGWLDHCGPLKHTLGPAGQQLRMGEVDAPPISLETDTAIIMGKRSLLPFFRPLLDSENDGIVSVESGKIEGMNEFHILDADHTFITTDPEAMNMTAQFLKDGKITHRTYGTHKTYHPKPYQLRALRSLLRPAPQATTRATPSTVKNHIFQLSLFLTSD